MVLGHEISHVILGHTEEGDERNAILAVLQIILMIFIDPSGGVYTLIMDYLVNQVRIFMTAQYSRDHENDADDLGLLITTMACYDVIKGINIFNKFAVLDKKHGTDLSDSHPCSIERYDKLKIAANKYEKGKNAN
eukprot:gene19864-28118_t